MFEQILDLPPKQRFLIYGGGIVLIVLLYIFLFYFFRATDIKTKQERISSLEQERVKLQVLVKDREKAKAEVLQIEGLFNQVKAQLPEQKEIPELLRQVSNLGRDSGLEVTLFRQKEEVLLDLYAEVPVEMAVRGGYHQIALFFDKVRHLDRIAFDGADRDGREYVPVRVDSIAAQLREALLAMQERRAADPFGWTRDVAPLMVP
jgi:type IV pilus assembly protein PilO